MRFPNLRAIVPCCIAALMCAAPARFHRPAGETARMESVLAGLNADEDVPALLDELNRAIRFQTAALGPEPSHDEARRLADMRYQAARAIQTRADGRFPDLALEQYQQVAAEYPDFNHGWPHFLAGQILESRGDAAAAAEAYRGVIPHNRSRLALGALFRIEYLEARETGRKADPDPLYRYFRFASSGVERDILPFMGAGLEDGPTLHYVEALRAFAAGDADKALEEMNAHRLRFPLDPSAAYRAAAFAGGADRIFPRDGNLLASCHLVNVMEADGMVMGHHSHVTADFYAPPEAAGQNGGLTVHMEMDAAPAAPFELIMLLNHRVAESVRVDGPREGLRLSIPVPPERIHNIVEVETRFPEDTPAHNARTAGRLTRLYWEISR